jgi:hypothetical protein
MIQFHAAYRRAVFRLVNPESYYSSLAAIHPSSCELASSLAIVRYRLQQVEMIGRSRNQARRLATETVAPGMNNRWKARLLCNVDKATAIVKTRFPDVGDGAEASDEERGDISEQQIQVTVVVTSNVECFLASLSLGVTIAALDSFIEDSNRCHHTAQTS